MTALDSTRTAVFMLEARLLKASDDLSCRTLVNVLRRDLKDTSTLVASAVLAVTFGALLANDRGNAVESKGLITGKAYPRCL